MTRVVGGLLAPLSIVTTGQDIVITLASTDGATPTSDANDVKGIIDGDAGGAADLVTVAVEGNGTGIVAAHASEPLTGGVNGTVGSENQIRANNGVLFFCTAAATAVSAGVWKKITLESL